MKKRILSVVLCLCMALSLLPTAAFAEENPEGTATSSMAGSSVSTPADDPAEEPAEEPATSKSDESLNGGATDEAVEAVRTAIAALPTAEQWEALSTEEQQMVGEAAYAASDAYDELTAEQQVQLTVEYASLTALFAAMNPEISLFDGSGVTAETIGDYKYAIYANGVPLLIVSTANTYSKIYIDTNKNGVVDSGEQEVTDLSGVYRDATNGYFLTNSTIYGGSKDATLTGDTYIAISGSSYTNTTVWLVYGGNASGILTGSSVVKISGGKVGHIYGGNEDGSITGSTNISVQNATVSGSVYGGGNSNTSTVSGTANITFGTGAIISGWVYGGGYGSNTSVGSTDITINGGSFAKNIYGGSQNGNVTNNTSVTINGGTVSGQIYGGNEQQGTVGGNTNVEINTDGSVGWVYGGSAGYASAANVTGTAKVTLTKGAVSSIVGGGRTNGSSVGNVEIELNGGTVSGSVYGGGFNNANVTGNVKISANPNATVYWIYGGSNRVGTVNGSVEITSSATDVYGIYAGGAGWESTNATVGENAVINVTGGSVGSVYASGGGNIDNAEASNTQTSTVNGNVTVNITGGTVQTVNTIESENSVFSGDIAVSANGGQVLQGCHFGRATSKQALKNVSLTLKDQTSSSLKVQFLVAISESLNVLIDGKLINLEMAVDVLKKTTGTKALTYQNCGASSNTWTQYNSSGTVSTKGTNPYTDFKQLQGNTFDTVTLKNCWLDYDGNTNYDNNSSLFTMANTLILDGGTFRCYLTNTALPAMQFINQPAILSSTTSNTEVLNFASVSGTAKIAILDVSGTTDVDPFSAIANEGTVIATAPSGTAANTFTYSGLDATKYVMTAETSSNKQNWRILPLSACRCSLEGAKLESQIAAITEGASAATMTLKDILEGSTQYAQDCPIPGHKDQAVQSTYAIVSDGTTASGAVISSNNQLTVTSAGQVKIHVTDTLNGKTKEYDSIVMFAKEPAQTVYTYNKSSSTGVEIKIYGDTLSADKSKTKLYRAPGTIGYLSASSWESTFDNGVLTVKILPAYLDTLDLGTYDDFGIEYQMPEGAGQGNFRVSVTITNKAIPTGAPTLSKTSLTYGELLSAITLSGDMNGVSGVFTWNNENATPSAGSYDAAWTFTPTDTDAYETVSGVTTIPVSKATPTGAPTYTSITSTGHTLADAVLSVGTIAPEGTIAWNDGDATNVTANTSYGWTFTPTDSTNYNSLTGTFTPYVVSGGSSSSSGSGSTTSSVTVPVSSNEGKVSVSASVSGSTATVTITDKQLAEIASNAANTGTVTVDLSSLKNVDSAKIPAKIIAAANTATGSEGLAIILPTGTVKLDETALASVASSNQDITVSVKEVKTSTLSNTQKEALGDKINSAVVVDVNVLVNGTKTSSFNGGTLTVSFPYTPKTDEDTSKLTVWHIKDDGTIEKMGGHYDAKDNCFVFETTHLSKYVLVSDTSVNPFTDVAEDAYYYDAVLWAVDKGVTSGTSATTFNPNGICTRAQTVTFLWRAMGSPEPTGTANPFTDVKSDAYYYKAVLWAAEKGITGGTSVTTFSPDATCSRSQVVTFLWRADGKSVVNYAMSFTDVAADSYYVEAVRWAVSEGITGGTSATTFAPTADCTRAQIVTFLCRYLSK